MIAGLAAALLAVVFACPDSARAQGASLALTKTASPTTYADVGETITYTYTVTNNGTSTFFSFGSLKIRDNRLGKICSVPLPFDPGESFQCTETYTTVQADIDNGKIKNKAFAFGDSCGECGITRSPTVDAVVTFLAAPSWTLAKTASPTTYSGPGETIDYSYLLTNTGNVAISGVLVSDDKAGATNCGAATIAIGAQLTCTATYTTTEADVTAGHVTNIATATGVPAQGKLPRVRDKANIRFVAAPAWTLAKTASPTTYSGPGETISYSYLLTNTGDVAISSVVVDDDKAGTANCGAATIAVGAQLTCIATYTTTAADVTAGHVTNIATATGVPARGKLPSVRDRATVRLVGAAAWTLTKSASPTTYTAAGQSIGYSYVLINTGNVAITAIALTDDKVAEVNCPSTALAVGASFTCSGTYLTTAADVSAGHVTNIAVAAGTPARGTLADVRARADIRFVGAGAGSITIVKTATGGDATFSFTSTVAGARSFSLTTSSGSASRSFPGLTSATYRFAEATLPPHWKLSTLSCAGDTGGVPTVVSLADRSASIGLDSGEAITCTFANSFDGKDDTTTEIADFLIHRATLLEDGPDRTRIFRRIPGYLWGNGSDDTGPAGGAVSFLANEDEGPAQMVASTSLLQLSEAYAQAQGRQLPMPSLDVWIETHYSEFEDDASGRDSNGHFAITYVGADYLVTPSVLVGALAQFDWTDQNSDNGASVEGFGVMAGPYISARLAPYLFFTARTAYGISDNSIDPFGLYTDDFSTDRWLASAQLTGNWQFGNWRLTPTAEATYVAEDQESYTDSLGERIPSQLVSVGRVSVGPEVAYRYLAEGGTVIEPQASLTGLWDFDSSDRVNIDALVTTDDDIRAMVKAGFLATMTGGASFRLIGTYDGIGSDSYESYGGQAWISIPLR